jgi:hypothetical protein
LEFALAAPDAFIPVDAAQVLFERYRLNRAVIDAGGAPVAEGFVRKPGFKKRM